MRSRTRCIAACWLAASLAGGLVAPAAAGRAAAPSSDRAPLPPASLACLSCHPSAGGVLSGPMATRAAERAFAGRALGSAAEGGRFFAESCSGCHVAGCDDCHGARPSRTSA